MQDLISESIELEYKSGKAQACAVNGCKVCFHEHVVRFSFILLYGKGCFLDDLDSSMDCSFNF